MPKPYKKRPPPEHLDHVFQDEWIDDWTEVADHLARLLKLPDLGTRSGLKKVHANLTSIQMLLDETFKHARHQGQTKIMAGVMELYIKMCRVDGLLQDKLLVAGFYERLVTLADFEDTRAVALRALGTVSLMSGKHLSSHFRKAAPTLLRIAIKHLDHYHTLHAVTGFFAHSSLSVKDMGTSFDITALGRSLVDSFRIATPDYWLFDHAMLCFNADLYGMAKKCRHMPSFVNLHVAFLHSQDYMRRVRSMGCLLKMALDEDVNSPWTPPDQRGCCFKTASLADGVDMDNLPPKLRQLVDNYGRDRTHISTIQRSRAKYASLLQESTSRNADLCKIGRSLAHLVRNYQYPFPDTHCYCGRIKLCDKCTPQLGWRDLVDKCIDELRKQSAPSDNDTFAADVLQWKLDSYSPDLQEWEELCDTLASRHPKEALFHYYDAHRQCRDPFFVYRKTTAAMDCAYCPRWLDFGLCALHAEACFNAAIQLGEEGDRGCYPMMMTARSDAKYLLDQASPDDPRRGFYTSIYVLSHLVLEGPEVNFKKPTLKRALKEIEISEEFVKIMGGPIPSQGDSTHIETAKLLRTLLPEALKEWGQLLQDLDAQYLKHKASGDLPSCSIERPLPDDYKNLDSWPENAQKNKETSPAGPKVDDDPPDVTPGSLIIKLSRCAWCGRPSAALRKCGGCGKERYCDTQCQKFHWEEHKAECHSTRPIVDDVDS